MSEPTIPGGYILLSRKLIESEIWKKPPLYLKVWIYLLSRAQHGEYKELKRGQLWVTYDEIIEGCSHKVGARIVKPNKSEVYRILAFLRKPDEGVHERYSNATAITTAKATRGLLINIENYSFYQAHENYERYDESDAEKTPKKVRTPRTCDRINKNDKNDKNNNIHCAFFEKMWSLYPNKVGKGKVSVSKKKEVNKLGDEFERCIERYIKHVDVRRKTGFPELKYQNGSTFFNSGYVDYLDKNYEEQKQPKTWGW